MDGDAPFSCINPEWLATKAGAVFDEDDDDGFNTRAPPTDHDFRRLPFTPFGRPQTPTRTTYGPLRRPSYNPALAPSPPASPTRIRFGLDPTARSFTPKQSPSRLRVETNVPQELATPVSPTPRTPRIKLSPAEDIGAIGATGNDAAAQAIRQRSRTRRQSSPGRRPTGVQRRGSSSSRKGPMLPPTTDTPMSRVVSAPGRYAQTPVHHRAPPPAPQTPAQRPGNLFLAPVQPMSPAAWLTQTHNVGYDDQLRGSQMVAGAIRPAMPAAPRSAPSRPRASTQGNRVLLCTYPGCRHRAQGKFFKTPGELRKHEKNHWPESERPLACTVAGCPRRFLWPKDVSRHIEVVHEMLKVRCDYCGAELCRGDDLGRHIATMHTRHVGSPRNWAAPSPSASSVTSFPMTPRSEYSYGVPSTPPTGSSLVSGSRPRVPHLTSFNSIREDGDDAAYSVPMTKSFTR